MASCGGEPAPAGRPLVVVTVVPQTWFVERLAGERVEAMSLLPPGASEALYEPTVAQLQAVSRAALYVTLGHPRFAFEQAWLARVRAVNPSLPVVATAADEAPASDPHVWLAPGAARRLARRTAAALEERFPEARELIEANAAALDAEIETLAAELHTVLDPHRGESFWVFHPAWTRLAEEYGLRQEAIEREGKEPDAHALAELMRRARAQHVRVVFVQPQLSDASARVVADEIGARVEVLDPLARDWAVNLRRCAGRIAAGAVR
jgi:zinc transport system substrate-binding protein